MRKPLLVIGILLLFSVVILSGCTQPQTSDQRFVGTWVGTYAWAGNFTHTAPTNVTFWTDGTYHASMPFRIEDGTWSVDGVILTKTMNGSTPVDTRFYSCRTTPGCS